MWEYKRFDFSYKSVFDLDEELKKIGNDNWEIIIYDEPITEKYERIQTVKILAKRHKTEN